MHHYRKTKRSYNKLNAADKQKKAVCPFPSCDPENTAQKTLYENKTMYVMANRVAYDIFAGRRVTDHLMIIPKRHVELIDDFTDQEKLDLMAIIGQYETEGYDIYARGIKSATRSVRHQHTHLIKMTDKKPKFLVYSERPYLLIDV